MVPVTVIVERLVRPLTLEAVMVAVPGLTAVTLPATSTVATLILLLDQLRCRLVVVEGV
jgi:hypothetical protein